MSATYFLPAIILCIVLLSCKDIGTDTAGVHKETRVSKNETSVSKNETVTKTVADGNGETGYILPGVNDSIIVESIIDSPHTPRLILINIKKPGKLTGEVITQKPVNIRINRVIDEHNRSDGPFGKQFAFEVAEPGMHTIEIGSSLMAEDPYTGPFILKLKLN